MDDCFNLSYVDILNKLKHVFMLMQYLDIKDSQRSGICLFHYLENVYLFIIEFVKFN